MRIFLIGNSFSGNATQYLPDLAREAGHELQIGYARIGGCSLKLHWENHQSDATYDGQTLRQLLQNQKWDVVSLQQASMDSADASSYQPYAQNLRDLIEEIQPQARLVWHQTWAYRADAAQFGRVSPTQHAQSQQEMWAKSRAAYHAIAAEMNAPLVPVGDAFWAVNSDPNWPSPRDANFSFDNPIYPAEPAQPNSLHRGFHWYPGDDGTWKIGHDPAHANEAGCYLGALVWYGCLFGSPENLTFTPDEVPADFASHLRHVAWQTVQQNA